MAIVKVQLKKHRQKKDGTFPIVIYVYEIKPQYVYTGFSVKETQFEEGQGNWIKRHPDAKIWNARIEDLRQEVNNSIVSGVGFVEGVRSVNTSHNFCEYLRQRGEEFKKEERFDMGLKCTRMAFELSQVLGRDVYSREIDNKFIRLYIAYCKRVRRDVYGKDVPGNSQNTIMRKIKNLRTLYKQAIGDNFASEPNPFASVDTKFDPVNRQKLSAAQINSIERLNLNAGDKIFHARNAFLFSYYCQGMRFENVCMMTRNDVKPDGIVYRMNKGKKYRELYIHQRLRVIIDYYIANPVGPYLFPFFKKEIVSKTQLRNTKGSANAIVNEYLKIIGDMAGISIPLSFHEARHSFAYQAKQKGVAPGIIQDALGHSDSKTTEEYLDSLDDDNINNAIKAVYE